MKRGQTQRLYWGKKRTLILISIFYIASNSISTAWHVSCKRTGQHQQSNKCHQLTCATLMPVQKLMFPRGCTAWSFDSILAVSGVSVVRTSQLLHTDITHCSYTNIFLQAPSSIRQNISYFAMVMRPTLFSGLLRVLEWQTILTASCWACSLVGKKSPLRMYSLLSTLWKINSSVSICQDWTVCSLSNITIFTRNSLYQDTSFQKFLINGSTGQQN